MICPFGMYSVCFGFNLIGLHHHISKQTIFNRKLRFFFISNEIFNLGLRRRIITFFDEERRTKVHVLRELSMVRIKVRFCLKNGWGGVVGGGVGKVCFTITARFGSKTCFLRWFHNRSVSFYGQKTREHVKTIKKRCLEAKNHIFFVKMHLKKGMFSWRISLRASLEGFLASFLAKSVDHLL